MKKLLLLPLVAILVYVGLSSYSAGYAASTGSELTGATGAAGCSCHAMGTTTTVALELDSAGFAVTHYIAGHSYTIKITGTNTSTTASLPKFGFEVACVSATGAGTASATNAGTLATTGLPALCQNSPAGSINVVEQSGSIPATSGTGGSGTTYVESIPWTAPTTAGSGSIKIYGVLNAVNGTGSSSGDKYNYTNVTITELVVPTLAPITGTTTVCTGSQTTLSDATGGGTWTSGTPSVATVTSSGVVTGVTSGTSVISYTTSGGTVTATVTVNLTPVAITGTASVCVGSAVTLADATPSGSWGSSNTSISTVTAGGVVTGVAAGLDTVVYAILYGTSVCYAYVPFTVNPLPNAGTITGGSSVCIGTPITLTDGTGGGTWSSGSPSIASVTSGGVVSGSAVGTAVISYSVTNSCGTAVATHTVTVGAAISAGTISGPTSVCAGSSITLTDGVGTGTWSSGSPLVASVSSSGLVTGLAGGTSVISYSVTGACGTATTTYSVTVNPLPVAGAITGPSAICIGTPITLTDASGGGTWSSGSPSVATVTSGGVVSGATSGTAVISYVVTNSCGTATATHSVAVSAPPTITPISGPTSVCAGSQITLSDVTGGGAWSSTAGASVSSTGVVTGVSAGISTISYSITTSCGSAATTYLVTVNPPPAVLPISGLATVCEGASITLSDGTGGGVWSSGTPGLATVSSTGVVSGVAGGAAIIDYSVTGTCGTTTVTYPVAITAFPAPGSIVGLIGACTGSTITLTDPSSGGTWSSSTPSVASITTGGVLSGLSVGLTTITYTITNACGTASVTHNVTVSLSPDAGTISGSGSVCQGASIALIDGVAGGVWSSSAPAIAVVGSTGIVTGVAGGTAIISYTATNVCGSVSATHTVTVTPIPNAGVLSGTSNICVGSVAALTDTFSGGIYNSGAPSIATVNSTGQVTGVSTGNTVITYTVTNACGIGYAMFPVTVSLPPVTGTITGASTLCAGSTIDLTDLAAGGVWSSSNPSTATVNTVGVVTGVSGGTATISYSVTSTCETLSAILNVTVGSLPDAGAISGIASVCLGSTRLLSESVPGGTWSSANPSIATILADGTVTGISVGTATIIYTTTNSCGHNSTSIPVTVVTGGSCVSAVANVPSGAVFNVYPNPSNGTFVIDMPEAGGEVSVVVTDMFGKVVASQIADNSNARINMSLDQLASGSYILKVEAGDKVYREKITLLR